MGLGNPDSPADIGPTKAAGDSFIPFIPKSGFQMGDILNERTFCVRRPIDSKPGAPERRRCDVNQFLQNQFVQAALPIMTTLVATVWIASWSQNKRFVDLRQDMNRQFVRIIAGLDRIEVKLVRVEERTSLAGRSNL